ncbi:hypothetical protein CW751_09900 [Brumimicrobium salinarum]|uniref:Uncharacterized protein n=1 Tax=Brumimicrobium salinarum TaxID=2058658 RepID=A0A2I0R1C9_9FLAO|nr:hypothetical protein [Brumimicrobium salinarum]PKR80376.1 hypothetical protein CW751_09900 [Brumimicrobium salinarum]
MEELIDFTETFRVKKGVVSARLLSVSGKEDDSFVIFAPTFNLSGYGNTRGEAEEMIKESFDDFVHYFLTLTSSEKELYLFQHGFSKEKFKSKNFSKAYIDENGELQNLKLENQSYELTNLVA